MPIARLDIESDSDKRQRLIEESIDQVMAQVSQSVGGMLYPDKLAVYAGINKRLIQRMDRKERKRALTVNRTGWEYKGHTTSHEYQTVERDFRPRKDY